MERGVCNIENAAILRNLFKNKSNVSAKDSNFHSHSVGLAVMCLSAEVIYYVKSEFSKWIQLTICSR